MLFLMRGSHAFWLHLEKFFDIDNVFRWEEVRHCIVGTSSILKNFLKFTMFFQLKLTMFFRWEEVRHCIVESSSILRLLWYLIFFSMGGSEELHCGNFLHLKKLLANCIHRLYNKVFFFSCNFGRWDTADSTTIRLNGNGSTWNCSGILGRCSCSLPGNV